MTDVNMFMAKLLLLKELFPNGELYSVHTGYVQRTDCHMHRSQHAWETCSF